jgi:hypothetical protein
LDDACFTCQPFDCTLICENISLIDVIDWQAIQLKRLNGKISKESQLVVYYKLQVKYKLEIVSDQYQSQYQLQVQSQQPHQIQNNNNRTKIYSMSTDIYQKNSGFQINLIATKNETLFINREYKSQMVFDNMTMHENSKLVVCNQNVHCIDIRCWNGIELQANSMIDANYIGLT